MCARLPRAVTSIGGCSLVCPFCRRDMGEAVIRLDDLLFAWEGDRPGWPARREDGTADTPLVVDCPTCARPSMIGLAMTHMRDIGEVRFIKLVPVRTEADARLLGGAA